MKKSTFAWIFLALILANSTSFAAPQAGANGNVEMVNVLVGFNKIPAQAERGIITALGGQVRESFTIVPAVAATVPKSRLNALSRNPNISIVEPDGIFELHRETPLKNRLATLNAELNNTWGVRHIRSATVHAMGETGANIGVAIVDTGIDYNHPELMFNYGGGFDYQNNDSDPFDDDGHGTHVAGTVAAAWNGLGVIGVAPNATVYALKALGPNGGSYSNVISSLQWIVNHNNAVRAGLKPGHVEILVANHSYGSSGDPGTLVRNAFNSSYAAGVLHIGSAGNGGNKAGNRDTVGFPAKYPSVMAVAATDNRNRRASFSATGPALEISAPGVSINSTFPNNRYRSLSGTSMASPHVAGVAALVFAANRNLSPDEVRLILQITAKPLGNSFQFGFGLIDALDAYNAGLN
jgi:subtilisin